MEADKKIRIFNGATAIVTGAASGIGRALSEELAGRGESAGINRHRAGGESLPHKRRSCSIMAPSHARAVARLHVKR